MKTRMLMFACRLAACVVAGALLSAACIAASFSADVVSKDGKSVTTGKIYVSDKKVRRETTVDGVTRITIVRADKGITWQLKPKDKTYVELKSAKLIVPDPADLKKFSEVNVLGEEKIAGYVCKKVAYIPKEEGGANIKVWTSTKLNWPLKVEIAHPGGTMVSEYSSIKEAKQDAYLFEPPYDYKKITLETPKTVPPK